MPHAHPLTRASHHFDGARAPGVQRALALNPRLVGTTPTRGACLVMAEAMRRWLGTGELWSVTSPRRAPGDRVEHVVVMLDGKFWDGAYREASAQTLLRAMRDREAIPEPSLLPFAKGDLRASDVVWDERVIRALQKELRRALGPGRLPPRENPSKPRAKRREVPAVLAHCVLAVATKGGGVRRAFAICTRSLQARGLLKPGTQQLTPKGRAAERKHQAERGAKTKTRKFRAMLRKERSR